MYCSLYTVFYLYDEINFIIKTEVETSEYICYV